ncbi:hypothetical protein NMY22_g4735 [Coprinellus aureogranulatus]|nr:hypothetical protein NMY22_g4735 [Coprinellus aureogranulatus]
MSPCRSLRIPLALYRPDFRMSFQSRDMFTIATSRLMPAFQVRRTLSYYHALALRFQVRFPSDLPDYLQRHYTPLPSTPQRSSPDMYFSHCAYILPPNFRFPAPI